MTNTVEDCWTVAQLPTERSSIRLVLPSMDGINWFTGVPPSYKLVYTMAEDDTLSPQARYQRKRRQAAGGSVTFFPRDKAALAAAAKKSGKTQQEWLAEAVDEKIRREGG